MKKIFAYVLIFLMCLGACSCTSEKPTGTTTATPTVTTTTTPPKKFGGIYFTPVWQDLTLSPREYQQYIVENELPGDFVFYESLSAWGELSQFYLLSNSADTWNDIVQYGYELLAPDGNTLSIVVMNREAWTPDYDNCNVGGYINKIGPPPYVYDVRLVRYPGIADAPAWENGEEFYPTVYEYDYVDSQEYAQLICLHIQVDDVWIHISDSNCFADYDMDGDSILDKFMSLENAPTVYHEFVAMIRGTAAE